MFLLGEGSLSRVQVILDAIRDEQWMRNIRYWHEEEHDRPTTIRLEAGDIVEVPAAATEPPKEDEAPSAAARTDGKRARAHATTG
jgi:hypothetical protein